MKIIRQVFKPLTQPFNYSGTCPINDYYIFYTSSLVIQILSTIPLILYSLIKLTAAMQSTSYAPTEFINENTFNQLLLLSVVTSIWCSLSVSAITARRLRSIGLPPILSLLSFIPIISFTTLILCSLPDGKFPKK